MVVLIEKGSPYFDIQTARKYYEENIENLDDINGFDWLFANSRFFNVYHHGYVGSVFVYQATDDKFYIGGYALRKRHKEVVQAIKEVSSMFETLYAHTRHLNAAIALQKAGFQWLDRNNKILIKSTN